MGTALRNPGQIVSFACDAVVAEGAVLVQGTTDDHVTLAGTPPITSGMIGLAKTATVNTTSNVDVVLNGVWPGIAGASITRGNALVVNSNIGDVRPYAAATDTFSQIVGYALESCNSGERCAMLLAPQANPAVPNIQTGSITLVAGVLTLSTGITITANSKVFLQLTTPGAGTNGSQYKVSGLVNGAPGVGSFTATAVSTTGGATVNTDTSVLSYMIVG